MNCGLLIRPYGQSDLPEEEEEITIHIIGEVKYPGIVILKTGQRIIDAIDAAGGETEEADLNKIQLRQLQLLPQYQ